MKSKKSSEKILKLIVSDEKKPNITLSPGMKIEVKTVQLVESSLKVSKKSAARLCGGTSTCVALVEVGD